MGLIRDRESELSELQRLVARLKDAARRHELSAAEWPLAMVAYTLAQCEDPAFPSTEAREAYAAFAQHAPAEARQASLSQLGQFITTRRGSGWRALLLYALCEPTASSAERAASLALTLAPPAAELRFAGAAALVQLLAQEHTAPPAMLSALLTPADLRLLPLLEPLYTLPQPRLQTLLAGLHTTLNSLSSACLLQMLETRPALASSITAALQRMAASTPLVADLVYPIPTWAYEQPAPQPLHAWTLPEYLERMRPRLAPYLNTEHLHTLESSFGVAPSK